MSESLNWKNIIARIDELNEEGFGDLDHRLNNIGNKLQDISEALKDIDKQLDKLNEI